MDKALQIPEKTESGNTDVIQKQDNNGPDVINDNPNQKVIRGTVEELREMLRQHNRTLKESNKTENNKNC